MPASRLNPGGGDAASVHATEGKLTLAELVARRAAVPPPPEGGARASLAERFLIPPFSVLDARQGYWQKRKRIWLALGIQSELGRGVNLQPMAAEDLGEGLNGYRAARADDNGLLGISRQARSHYRPNATPTGRAFPSATIRPGEEVGDPAEKYARGDGRGRPLARHGTADMAFDGGPMPYYSGNQRGADNRAIKDHAWLAAHGHGIPQAGKGAHPIPGGSTGKNSAYMFKTSEGYRPLKEIQAGETASLEGGLLHGTTIHPYDGGASEVQSGTSIFDPVLCELAYRWFTPSGGAVLDPFAGGSVRGIVAARLGRRYAGMDLRQEQVDANYAQADAICPDGDVQWMAGDSRDIGQSHLVDEYDFIFSCPPYADLERYSDDPRDLSTMGYGAFLEAYRHIIRESCAMLRDDRFACFVVGDVRDRATGNYRNFVGDTVQAFRDAGLELYNEAVLITAVGSLPIRVGRQFEGYRKLGKSHQNVLVFLKGDAGRAAAACGEVDLDDLTMPPCEPGRVAVCAADVAALGGEPIPLRPDGADAVPVDLPLMEACLMVDVVRGRARAEGRAAPRAWVGTADGWRRVDDAEELTYLVGDAPYLSREVFPDADVPAASVPAVRRLRGT